MTIIREFREFIARGNVVDLAVGVIIGAAFGKIVTSMVEQVVMPPVGLLLGKVDFNELKLILQRANPQYGAFINTIIQFVIVALVVFLMVRVLNAVRRKEAQAPSPDPAPTAIEALLTEIRDLLKRSH